MIIQRYIIQNMYLRHKARDMTGTDPLYSIDENTGGRFLGEIDTVSDSSLINLIHESILISVCVGHFENSRRFQAQQLSEIIMADVSIRIP